MDKDEAYERHLLSLKRKDKLIEKDDLLRRIDRQELRITRSSEKINIYTMILVFFLSMIVNTSIVNFIKERLFSSYHNFFTCIHTMAIIFIIYYFIRVFVILFNALKVKSISMSTFSSLKNSSNKCNRQIQNLYYDWQESREYADRMVTYVQGIECYLKK